MQTLYSYDSTSLTAQCRVADRLREAAFEHRIVAVSQPSAWRLLAAMRNTMRKGHRTMRETCFCGWMGDVADREPIPTRGGDWMLACPQCGHVDDLHWLPEAARGEMVREARRRAMDAKASAAPALPILGKEQVS